MKNNLNKYASRIMLAAAIAMTFCKNSPVGAFVCFGVIIVSFAAVIIVGTKKENYEDLF